MGSVWRSGEPYQMAWDNAPVGMLLVAEDRRITRANRSAGELLGQSAEALAGADLEAVLGTAVSGCLNAPVAVTRGDGSSIRVAIHDSRPPVPESRRILVRCCRGLQR